MPQVKQSRYAILLILLGVIIVAGSHNSYAIFKNNLADASGYHDLSNASVRSYPIKFTIQSKQIFDTSFYWNFSVVSGGGSGYSLYNTSTNDFDFLSTKNKTIEWFFRSNITTSDTDSQNMITISDGSTKKMMMRIANTASKKWNLTFSNEGSIFGIADFDKRSTKNINNSQVWHAAMVWYSYNTGNVKKIQYYLNGTEFLQMDWVNPETSFNRLDIGCNKDGTSCFRGILDEIRISNVSRYTANFTPPKTIFTSDNKTIALYHFENLDISSNQIYQCNSLPSFAKLIYNYTFADEINLTRFNITKFTAYYSAKSLNSSSVLANGSISSSVKPNNIGICIIPKGHFYKVNSTVKYEKAGFNFRNYYDLNKHINITPNIKSLFLLQDTQATLITILTTDSLDTPLKDIITEIQRFYIANNSFNTIGMIKSGEDGKDVVYLQQNSPQYRFLVYQYGILVKTTTGQVISSASYSITIIPTSLSDLITNARNLITNITFNNHTKSFHYGFYDPSSKIFGACLQVSLSNGTGKYYKPLNCTYGSYRNLLKLSPGNRTGSVYDGFGYVIFNGSTLYHGQRPLQFLDGLYFNAKTWGKYGLYLLIILLTMLVMIPIASGSPTAALVIMMVGLFSAWWMDIFSVSTLVFTSLMIGLGIVIKELRSG